MDLFDKNQRKFGSEVAWVGIFRTFLNVSG